ncbi:MAG TPA: ABC transporter permease [Acidimicrobiales bacterium]|nr:ABC transporter permease [Acidimicrobiales bacterium]
MTITPDRQRGPAAPAAAPGTAVAERASSGRQRLYALVRKEFVQIRRDRRTLGLIIFVPVILMIVFGYAASFDVHHLPTELIGHDSPALRAALTGDTAFRLKPGVAANLRDAEADIKHGRAVVAITVGADGRPTGVVVDGSRLLEAMTAERHLSALQAQAEGGSRLPVTVLYNPALRSADFMVPGLIGQIMVQVGLLLTAVGIVRERERGTIEQLMITPLTKGELMVGKTVPYLVIAFIDLSFILLLGWGLFGVPMRGSLLLLVLEAALFLIATLGMGLLISTVAQTQQQAMQMAVFIQLPQMLLSGLIFPLASIPWAIRWICYLFPLTYFLPISRGIMLKGSGLDDLWPETVVLVLMAIGFVALAAARFRKTLD